MNIYTCTACGKKVVANSSLPVITLSCCDKGKPSTFRAAISTANIIPAVVAEEVPPAPLNVAPAPKNMTKLDVSSGPVKAIK